MDEQLRVDRADTDQGYIISYWRETPSDEDGINNRIEGVDGRGDTLQDAIQDLAAGISIYIDD